MLEVTTKKPTTTAITMATTVKASKEGVGHAPLRWRLEVVRWARARL
jgi:hypothetical protein